MNSEFPPALLRPVEQALALCDARTTPISVVIGGSIVRGQGDAHSDLDIYVLHDAPWRQRVQRVFDGVPCEIFINNAAHIASYFESENQTGRPITAHLLSTGRVVRGADDPRTQALLAQAQDWLARPPSIDAHALEQQRYMIACTFEDAIDTAERDPATCALFLGHAVPEALFHAFLARGRHVPRIKQILDALPETDPALAAAARVFYADAPWPTRYQAALRIADLALGTRGFFEWESRI
jgi:hypothetical protein